MAQVCFNAYSTLSQNYLSKSVIHTSRRSVRKTWGKWNVGQFGLEVNVRRASCAPFLQSFHQVVLTLVVKFQSQIKQRQFCISIWSFLWAVHLTCGLCPAETSITAFCYQSCLYEGLCLCLYFDEPLSHCVRLVARCLTSWTWSRGSFVRLLLVCSSASCLAASELVLLLLSEPL